MSTLQEKIAVMQAFERGEPVQYRAYLKDTWKDTQTPFWNWPSCDYRVKPKPLERWMVTWQTAIGPITTAHETRDLADVYAAQLRGRSGVSNLQTIHMREVVE